MNLNEQFQQDKTAFEDGTYVPLGGDAAVKVRSPQSAHSKAIRKKLEAPYASMTRGGKQLPDDIAEDILLKQMSQSLIVSWKGIKDDGVEIEPTPENIEKMLRKYPRFRDTLGGIIANDETYAALVREDDLKN
jgi:hypothetical protein